MQDASQYCSYDPNTPFALSLSKGWMYRARDIRPFDKLRANGV